MNLFDSAVRGTDGEVDAGYLALFCLMVVVLGVIPLMCLGALVQMWKSPTHLFDVQSLGIGVGAVCTGFAAAIGGVGAFRMGDKPRAPVVTPSSVTATASGSTATASVDQPSSAVSTTLKGKK